MHNQDNEEIIVRDCCTKIRKFRKTNITFQIAYICIALSSSYYDVCYFKKRLSQIEDYFTLHYNLFFNRRKKLLCHALFSFLISHCIGFNIHCRYINDLLRESGISHICDMYSNGCVTLSTETFIVLHMKTLRTFLHTIV